MSGQAETPAASDVTDLVALDAALQKQIRRAASNPLFSPTRISQLAHASSASIPPARSCQYPVTTVGRKHTLCGSVPVVPGKPYCLAHCVVCFRTTQERKREDARVARAARPHLLDAARVRSAGTEQVSQDD